MIEKLKYLAPVRKSHHTLPKYNFCCYTKSTISGINKYKYDKGNYDGMIEMMTSRNWKGEFKDNSTEYCWAILEKSIRNATNMHIPKHSSKKAQTAMDKFQPLLQSRESLWHITGTENPEMSRITLNTEEH